MKAYMKAICMQMKLMVHKREFQFVLCINMAYALLTYLYYAFLYQGRDISTIPSPNAVFALQDISIYYGIYINIVPFLVVFPFAMSYIDDYKNLLLPILQIRSGAKIYYISKAVACFVGGFAAFFLPLMVNIVLNHLTFPASGITFMGDLYDMNYDAGVVGANIYIDTDWAGLWFPQFFMKHPEGYNILFSIIFSLAMGVFSTFTYSISFVLKRQKIILLLPLYLIIVVLNTMDMFLRDMLPYMCYKIFPYISVNSGYGKNPIYIYVFFLILIILTCCFIYRQVKKDQL